MVMCASTPEKVEILEPPSSSKPGDKVTVDGFTGVPDQQLNPKKKVCYSQRKSVHDLQQLNNFQFLSKNL